MPTAEESLWERTRRLKPETAVFSGAKQRLWTRGASIAFTQERTSLFKLATPAPACPKKRATAVSNPSSRPRRAWHRSWPGDGFRNRATARGSGRGRKHGREGTTFTLRLPASKAENEPTLVAAGAFDRSLHILIVDDQPVLCELLANFLKNDLHMVEIAQSAQQALENSKSAPSTS